MEQECEGLQYQVEVRSITQRISSLGEKLDSACILGDPRENAFLTCDFRHNDSVDTVTNSLQSIGRVRTSTTFPSLCTAVLGKINCLLNFANLRVRICIPYAICMNMIYRMLVV